MPAGTTGPHRPVRMALTMLALCFACYAGVRGLQETYPIFLLPLAGDFGWSRGEASSVYSFAFAVVGLSGPLIGFLSDRWGPLQVMLLGVVLASAAALIASRAEALWQFHLTVGIAMGIAAGCAGFVPMTALLSRWFRARLNTALAIAHSASGAGILVLGPTTQTLIDLHGWRSAYLLLGLGVAALLPLFLVFRWRDALAGRPGIGAPTGRARRQAGGPDLRDALGTPAFWSMAFTFACTSMGMFLVFLQTPAYLVEAGYDSRTAAEIYGLVGLVVPAGMVGFGWLGDRIGRPRAVIISYALTIAGIGCLMAVAQLRSPVLIGLFVVLFGGTFGCRGPAMSTIAATIFRGAQFGRIYGFITVGMGLGGAAGAWLGGFLYDVTGGYATGLTLAMALLALGAAPFAFVRVIARA